MTAQQSHAIPNQPGLNIDLFRMREAALHAQVHGTVFKASGSQVRQVLDYLHERTLEIKGLNARIAVLEAQQGVPQGWKLVPVSPPDEMARAFRADDAPAYFLMTTIRCADFSERYAAMLAAAPTPPGQESQPLTDSEIIAAQEALIEAKDVLYRSRIGLQCTHCKKGTYRADGNGYYDFHRCEQCRYVPMWNADGTEFGIQEKPDGPTV